MKLLLCALLLIKSGAFLNASENEDTTLKLLQIVSRHGIRTGFSKIGEAVNNPKEYQILGDGQLTKKGRALMYSKGNQIRKRYSRFLEDNPQLISARSSNSDRCLESAMCMLASMYPPKKQFKWNEELNWQPVPVQTAPPECDRVLNDNYTTPIILKMLKNDRSYPYMTEIVETVKRHTGIIMNDMLDIFLFADYCLTLLANEYAVPDWYFNLNGYLNDVTLILNSYVPRSTQLSKLASGNLLTTIIDNMINMKVSRDGKNKVKAHLFATHDVYLGGLFGLLQADTSLILPFGATLLIETHETRNAKLVKMYYLNETEPAVFHPLCTKTCGCKCTVEKFASIGKY